MTDTPMDIAQAMDYLRTYKKEAVICRIAGVPLPLRMEFIRGVMREIEAQAVAVSVGISS